MIEYVIEAIIRLPADRRTLTYVSTTTCKYKHVQSLALRFPLPLSLYMHGLLEAIFNQKKKKLDRSTTKEMPNDSVDYFFCFVVVS